MNSSSQKNIDFPAKLLRGVLEVSRPFEFCVLVFDFLSSRISLLREKKSWVFLFLFSRPISCPVMRKNELPKKGL